MCPRWFGAGRIARDIVRHAIRSQRRFLRRRTRRLIMGGIILLAIAGTHRALKLRDRDVNQLESYYGRPVENLSEEEIDQGMKNLNIQNMNLDENDKAKIYEMDDQDEGLSSSGQKYCTNCGDILEKGASFCMSCGSKI